MNSYFCKRNLNCWTRDGLSANDFLKIEANGKWFVVHFYFKFLNIYLLMKSFASKCHAQLLKFNCCIPALTISTDLMHMLLETNFHHVAAVILLLNHSYLDQLKASWAYLDHRILAPVRLRQVRSHAFSCSLLHVQSRSLHILDYF